MGNTTLRIMSNNIWWCDGNREAWESKGLDCSAEHRADGFYRVYKELMPDIIGLQECTALMAKHLMTLFAEDNAPYAFLWGRDTPIVYRRDKLELVDSQVLIYPEQIEGYEGEFNNAKTKSYCIGVFRIKENGKLLIFATTHLWYKSSDPESRIYQAYSAEARTYQLNLLCDKLDELQKYYNCPSIIVGDLNTHYNSQAIQSVLKRGFVHGHDVSLKPADDITGTHYCFGDGFTVGMDEGGFARAIDHLLIKGASENSVKCYERYTPDYYMPLSDHFPLWIDLETTW